MLARLLHYLLLQQSVNLCLTLEGGPAMLMRNPEYQIASAHKCSRPVDVPFVDDSHREMLLGQFALILLFVIAILLRSMT